MQTSKPEQSPANSTGTAADSDRKLTDGRSGPVRYEVLNKDGDVCNATFFSAHAAGMWAQAMWPYQQQDPERTGAGWDVRAVGAK